MDERTFGQSMGRLAMLALVVAVVGLVGGYVFAKGQPRAAAGAVVADFVEVVPSIGNGDGPADPDAVAPTSGDHAGRVRCGLLAEAIGNDDHLESLAAGVVVVRHAPDLDAEQLDRLAAFVEGRDRVLVAPEPRLDVPVVAVAWAHRMPIGEVNVELLAAFHTSRVGIAPDAVDDPCP